MIRPEVKRLLAELRRKGACEEGVAIAEGLAEQGLRAAEIAASMLSDASPSVVGSWTPSCHAYAGLVDYFGADLIGYFGTIDTIDEALIDWAAENLP